MTVFPISRAAASVKIKIGVFAATLFAGISLTTPSQTAVAQTAAPSPPATSEVKPAQDRCLALANRTPRRRQLLHRAGIRYVKLQPYQIRLSFLGHATFLLESPKGIRIATDYAVPILAPNTPHIATMNIAHSSHYTLFPQKEIKHVLPGWNDKGGAIVHDLMMEDVRVRNVSTNIRSWGGETREFGNSVFVFEIGPLCIAHLGHLHHPLSTNQLANIGQMDVVLTPVDGSFTLDTAGMMEVLAAMNPRLIVPMHYFTENTLQRFLEVARKRYPVRRLDVPTMVVSKDALPLKTEVVVLPGN